MLPEIDLRSAVTGAWATNQRTTVFLIERIPPALWNAPASEARQRTVRSIAAHLHNSRRQWLRTLGEEHGIAIPDRVDPKTVTRRALISALGRSGRGMLR